MLIWFVGGLPALLAARRPGKPPTNEEAVGEEMEHVITAFYQLGDDGHYRLVPPDADGSYHSRALAGFRLRPDWLWQEPLPKVLNVARELGFLD